MAGTKSTIATLSNEHLKGPSLTAIGGLGKNHTSHRVGTPRPLGWAKASAALPSQEDDPMSWSARRTQSTCLPASTRRHLRGGLSISAMPPLMTMAFPLAACSPQCVSEIFPVGARCVRQLLESCSWHRAEKTKGNKNAAFLCCGPGKDLPTLNTLFMAEIDNLGPNSRAQGNEPEFRTLACLPGAGGTQSSCSFSQYWRASVKQNKDSGCSPGPPESWQPVISKQIYVCVNTGGAQSKWNIFYPLLELICRDKTPRHKSRTSWGSGTGKDRNCKVLDMHACKMGDTLLHCSWNRKVCIKSTQMPCPGCTTFKITVNPRERKEKIAKRIAFWLF